MENVINAKERNYAFGIFIISFVITVAIIIGAVYFNTLIPGNENDLLRKEIKAFNKQIEDQSQFILAMKGVKILNDSLNKLGIVHPLVDRKIMEHLNSMDNWKDEEGILYGGINTDIFNFAYEYTEMNKRLLNLNQDLKDVEALKNDLSRVKGELELANRSLDAYRNSSNLGLGRQ